MESAPNIELFNLSVAEVLGGLYESFPSPCTLKALEVGDAVKGYYPNASDDINAGDRIYHIASDTVHWLKRSGYIDFKGEAAYQFTRAVLTAKGLQALNAMPESLENKPIGDALLKGTASVGLELMKVAAKEFLGAAVKL